MTDVLSWLAIVVAAAPIWGAVVWEVCDSVVRPRLIPQAEIDALARDLVARYGSFARAMAIQESESAAWRTDSFEAAKWRRVCEALSDR